MTEELYKRRSIAECIDAAWTLFSTNLTTILRTMWLPALLIALFCMAAAPFSINIQLHHMQEQMTIPELITAAIMLVAFLALQVYLNAKIFKMLNEQTLKFCLKRSLNFILVWCLLMFIFMIAFIVMVNGSVYAAKTLALTEAKTLWVFMAGLIFILLLAFIFYSPFVYALTKYMIEPSVKIQHSFKNYRIGFRKISYITTCLLLCLIILGVVYCVAALPNIIIAFTSRLSNEGIVNGDPSGLPHYFTALTATVAFLTSFITTALYIWSVFAMYYMYASIEAKNGRTDEQLTEIKE
jgi:hypothetical protein